MKDGSTSGIRRPVARGILEAKTGCPRAIARRWCADQPDAPQQIVGMLPEGNWITRAPDAQAQGHPVAKVQDEGGATACTLRGGRDARVHATTSSTR